MNTIQLTSAALALLIAGSSAASAKQPWWFFGYVESAPNSFPTEEDRAACYNRGQLDGMMKNNVDPDIQGLPKGKCRESYEAGKKQAADFFDKLEKEQEKNCVQIRKYVAEGKISSDHSVVDHCN